MKKRYTDLTNSDKLEILLEFFNHHTAKEIEGIITNPYWDRFEAWTDQYLSEAEEHEAYKENTWPTGF